MKLKRKTDIAFSGAGFMGIYYVGVVHCINIIAPDLLQQRIGGTSAGGPVKNYCHFTNLFETGALQGVFLMAKVPFEEMARSIVNLALISSKQLLTTFNPTFNLSNLIRKSMEEVLPANIHLVVQDRLLVSMTKVWNPSNLAVNKFRSKAELLDALQGTSFVPFVCGLLPPRFKGSLVYDGFFTDNLPVFDSNTISVSPFAGNASICPKDDTFLSFLKINMPNGKCIF